MFLAQTTHKIYNNEAVGCGIFDRFLKFDNCQPEVVSDVTSDMADQDVGADVFTKFGDSRLKSSEGSFSALLRASKTSDRKYVMTSYPVCL